MTLADSPVFTVEVLVTGVHANGFGEVGDGRSFAFRIEDSLLRVEIYRAFRTELVPDDSDVVAAAPGRSPISTLPTNAASLPRCAIWSPTRSR